MISVVIPILNEDEEQLGMMLRNLTKDCFPSELEVVLVNDGSENPDASPLLISDIKLPEEIRKFITPLELKRRHGVGYAFDMGVYIARGDIIVLAGADVYPEEYWISRVRELVRDDEMGCGASIGLQPGNYDINAENLYARYGARIIYKMVVDDLPKKSELRKIPHYRDILEAKWLGWMSDAPYELECVYGAYYWLKRDSYIRMHGFDTISGVNFRGHQYWGCLEPHLSLKARVYGLKCMMYPDFRVGHIFGRIGEGARANKLDYKIWNKYWVAHTLLDDELRDEVIAFLPFSKCQSQAAVWVKQNWDAIQEVRERNKREGKLISKDATQS